MSKLIENYDKNLSTVNNVSVTTIFNSLSNIRTGRTNRATVLKLTLLNSILSNLPNIKQHKRYL